MYLHYIRGVRLGFPCPNYFDNRSSSKRLRIQMDIMFEDWVVGVYFYMCKDLKENVDTAVDIWYKFRPYASA